MAGKALIHSPQALVVLKDLEEEEPSEGEEGNGWWEGRPTETIQLLLEPELWPKLLERLLFPKRAARRRPQMLRPADGLRCEPEDPVLNKSKGVSRQCWGERGLSASSLLPQSLSTFLKTREGTLKRKAGRESRPTSNRENRELF